MRRSPLAVWVGAAWFGVAVCGCALDLDESAGDAPYADAADAHGGAGDTGAELESTSQSLVATENGLDVINGLTISNGLKTLNGLTTENGLKVLNGLKVINGLTTVKSLRTVNGYRTIGGVRRAAVLNVDCSGGQILNTNGTNDGTCTGRPDGLLNRATGLMSSAPGVKLAKYLIKCALPSDQSIRVLSYTGDLVSMPGGLNLAPGWLKSSVDPEGSCGPACEEKISACLLSLTNGDGAHIGLELSSNGALGTGHSAANIYQEAAFYGNLFADPPEGYVTPGLDYGPWAMARSCPERDHVCPYMFTHENADCTWTDKDGRGRGTATECVAGGRRWYYPVTSFRAAVVAEQWSLFRDDEGGCWKVWRTDGITRMTPKDPAECR